MNDEGSAPDIDVRVLEARATRTDSWTTLIRASAAALRSPSGALRLWRSAGDVGLRAFLRALPAAGGRPDVVHLDGLRAAGTYASLVRCFPSVVSVHPGEARRIRGDQRRALEDATLIHCVFEADVTELVAQDIDPGRIHVLRAGSRRVPGVERSVPRTRVVLVCAQRLDWRSGVTDLLGGVGEAVRRGVDVEVVIFGKGPERDRVWHTIHDLGLRNRSDVREPSGADEVLAAVAGATASAHLDVDGMIDDGVLRAMAIGVPVLALDRGSAAEAIRDGREGILVPAASSAAVAGAIEQLADGADHMGEAARRRLGEEFEGREAAMSQVLASAAAARRPAEGASSAAGAS